MVARLEQVKPKVAKPVLTDYVIVCRALGAAQRAQYEALNGIDYDPDTVAAELYLREGPSWVLLAPDQMPLMVGGFTMIGTGVWQDWLMSTDEVWHRFPKAATRTCRDMVETLLMTDAHRVQAVVLADRHDVRAWYRLIGYEHEGTLRGYGAAGEDVVIYGRTSNDGRTQDPQ